MAGVAVEYFAHSVPGAGQEHWEILEDHLAAVAERAREFASKFGAAEWGEAAGLWHDLGKYRPEFQRRIRGEALSAPHAACGAVLALRHHYGELALVIAGHHTGVANVDAVEAGCPRPLRQIVAEAQAWLTGIEEVCPMPFLARPELARPRGMTEEMQVVERAAADLWVRMLFSTLVDADRLATESFYEPGKRIEHPARQLESLCADLDAHLDALEESTPIDTIRRQILLECRASALRPPGVFSLTVPTGGGKTLSGMAFALHHANEHGLDRVIVVAPFTSIIDQNAAVYRNVFGADRVLEHHSNVAEHADDEEGGEAERRRQLLAENWDAPIVVTTAVQFLESLFANSPAQCRKLHNIVNSVIVIDEAQTIPLPFLRPVLDVLRELVRGYGCSIVLSTATQPALKSRTAFEEGFVEICEIIDDPRSRADALRRVVVHWPDEDTTTGFDDVAAQMAAMERAMAVVHTRADARALAQLLPVDTRLHLSTRMCPQHRHDTIGEVRSRQKHGQPCHLAATSLVEAGVDIDFPLVFRAIAGLDSLAQAAGRCNRNGLLKDSSGSPLLGAFVVFRGATQPPDGLRGGVCVTEAMLREASRDAGALDLFDPQVLEEYFRRLLVSVKRDGEDIVSLYGGRNLATIARRFNLISDGDSVPLVVPYGNADVELSSFKRAANRESMRRLQRFAVSLRPSERDELMGFGAISSLDGFGFVLIAPYLHLYDPEFGFSIPATVAANPEYLIA